MKKNLLAISVLSLVLFAGCKKDDGVVLSEEDQLAADIELIDKYLSDNNIDAEIHESGIRFVTKQEGTGDSPSATSSVIVKYTGTLLNGQTFDRNDLGANFNLNGLIEAWKLMIPEMKEGGKIIIYAPSLYGYGRSGQNPIPPNAVLVFEIELISLVRSTSEQLAIDLEKIDQYLTNNDIEAQIHSSGIRYQVIEEGNGLNPNLTDLITVNYFGQFLDGEIFDPGGEASFRLTGLIDAWKTMVPTMQEGEIMIIYAPSGYCYGNTGNGVNIGPITNLIFQIELISISK
jgi:FKBP-type peptidyl-prolyl cis-trans isomerase FklB